MRRFVSDQAGATKFLVFGGILVQHQTGFAVENGTNVLHAAILEAGHQGKIEFGKRQLDARVFLHPLDGVRVQVKNVLEVALHFGLVVFAVQHGHAAAIAGLSGLLEFSGTKRKNIGAESLGGFEIELFARSSWSCTLQGPIAHCFPIGGNVQMQGVTGLEIGLIKTGENRGSPIRHHQGIQVICAAVERLVAGFKADLYLVFANL